MKGCGNLFRNNFLPLIFTSVIFGVVHISNPEVSELGYGTMYFYIGTGFYLGVITLLDDANAIAPPEPPSPIITEIVGTFKSIEHSIDLAIASA